MIARHKALVLAAVQVGIVASLGAKAIVDRTVCPRVWVRTVPPGSRESIRGHYLQRRIEVDGSRELANDFVSFVSLRVQDGRLIAVRSAAPTTIFVLADRLNPSAPLQLYPPLTFFLPGTIDPKIYGGVVPDTDLWAEVTLPKRGAPRPIRLGVRKNGVLTPL